MTPINMKVTPAGTAIACGAILTNFLDFLVENQRLSNSEIRVILQGAMIDLGPRARQEGGSEAQLVVADLLRKFPQNAV